MNVNPFSLSGIKTTNLRMLSFLAADQEPDTFWSAVFKACQDEEAQRAKPASERCEIIFEIPSLNALDASVARNELGLMITRLRNSPDDCLVLLLAASAKALGAQIDDAATRN